MSAAPKRFFRAATTDAPALEPVDPIIPPRGPHSLGFDAALPADEPPSFSSELEPWRDVSEAWMERIEREDLADVQITHYRTTVGKSQGLALRITDGALTRLENGPALAYTQRAWAQLVGLLLQEVPNKPRAPAEPYRFLGPQVRRTVFEHIRNRSRRKEGEGNELLLRSFVDQRYGTRALRAVVSGRHSGIHFDDLALADVLSAHLAPTSLAYCRRSIDETRGHAVLDEQGDARAMIHWRNSETGAASLSFSAGCYIRVLDSMFRVGELEVEREVLIASVNEGTRRAHTLPRKGQSEGDRAKIAAHRIGSDVEKVTAQSKELCNAWGQALERFAKGWGGRAASEVFTDDEAGRKEATQVILDLIEENTRGFSASDRLALQAILESDERLPCLPFASAAHIAGAWAVLASRQGDWEEAKRCQMEAGHWVTEGFL